MKLLAAAACLLFSCAALYGQQADVTYVEGGVDLAPAGAARLPADIGDSMQVGDSIITADDGRAQLEREDTSEVDVSPGTVFTLRQLSEENGTREVFAVALGSVSMSFNAISASEPAIATASASAGIRGTQMTVYAGADGSSLFVVKSGQVGVQSAGKMVTLLPNEGVEVKLSQPPGEKFSILRGQVDYSTWNKQKIDDILLDPAGAALNVEIQLNAYLQQLDDLVPKYRESKSQLDANRIQMKTIGANQGKEAMQKYYQESVYPLEILSSSQYLNIRYYALSALSLRRFVLGRMYIRFASMYINDRENAVYQKFLEVYHRVLATYEQKVTPFLVAADL